MVFRVSYGAFSLLAIASLVAGRSRAAEYDVSEDDEQIQIVTPQLEAAIRK
jgi:hypothetical protein